MMFLAVSLLLPVLHLSVSKVSGLWLWF